MKTIRYSTGAGTARFSPKWNPNDETLARSATGNDVRCSGNRQVFDEVHSEDRNAGAFRYEFGPSYVAEAARLSSKGVPKDETLARSATGNDVRCSGNRQVFDEVHSEDRNAGAFRYEFGPSYVAEAARLSSKGVPNDETLARSATRSANGCALPCPERGSVLVVAMVFATLLAMTLGSYVALNTQSLKLANRTYYAAEAVNMAEAGLEEAIWSFNQTQSGVTTAWAGWNIGDGVKATRTFTNFTLGPGVTGTVKVYIDRFNPPAGVQPLVVARSTVALPHGQAEVSRHLEMRLKRRSLFAGGIVARKGISFSGNNASVDSWISDPDNNPATAAIPYSAAVRRDKGSVAAASVTATISVGNADIWGTAAVGGSSVTSISVGSNGRVGAFGTAGGVKDPAYIATDFVTNLETVATPAGGTVIASLGATIGSAGATTMWRTPNIANNLTVFGNVTLVLTAGSGVDAISISGNEGITLAPGATLTVYTEGNVKLAGNGILNPNDQPVSFQLWGTNTSPMGQEIQIAGNGAMKGIVYAPNGNVKINGNGDVMGAIVANEASLTGNAAFHYDESLANWGVNTPYGIVKWRELYTAADRATRAPLLNF